MVNRLKPFIGELITKNQDAFFGRKTGTRQYSGPQ